MQDGFISLEEIQDSYNTYLKRFSSMYYLVPELGQRNSLEDQLGMFIEYKYVERKTHPLGKATEYKLTAAGETLLTTYITQKELKKLLRVKSGQKSNRCVSEKNRHWISCLVYPGRNAGEYVCSFKNYEGSRREGSYAVSSVKLLEEKKPTNRKPVSGLLPIEIIKNLPGNAREIHPLAGCGKAVVQKSQIVKISEDSEKTADTEMEM
jgi:hypothetical protein